MMLALWAAAYVMFGLLIVGLIVARDSRTDCIALLQYFWLSVFWPFVITVIVIDSISLFFDRYDDIMPVLSKIFGGGKCPMKEKTRRGVKQ